MRFWKQHSSGEDEARSRGLGPLERELLDLLWSNGESNVHQISQAIGRPLAYTTVMTTLDRLYKKGVLTRRKLGRAYSYFPSLSRQQWYQVQTEEFLAASLSGHPLGNDLLISCFVDAVGQTDESLLDELEKKIRAKREELSSGEDE